MQLEEELGEERNPCGNRVQSKHHFEEPGIEMAFSFFNPKLLKVFPGLARETNLSHVSASELFSTAFRLNSCHTISAEYVTGTLFW